MGASLGWLGGILLALCALPQAVASYKQGHSAGISITFLFMWGLGELLVLLYVWPSQDWPLIVNYAVNLVLIAIIARYRLWPRS